MAIIPVMLRFFEQKMLEYGKRHGRKNLPWRKNGTASDITPYEVWVSEILLQQTQASRVIGYYKNFLRRFPSVFDLAQTSWEKLLPYYRGLGYYQRARNMLKTAKIIVEEYHGVFPKDKKLLCALPGIGEYTASAILNFGYHEPVLAVDTNVQKVLSRYLHGTRFAHIEKIPIENALKKHLHEINAAIMDFAGDICQKRPQCAQCPLQLQCRYFQTQGTLENKQEKEKGRLHVLQVSRKTFPAALRKSARVFLWLHKNHEIYYSPLKRSFRVFILPARYNTRAGIKQYFLKKYQLEIAVRPPHQRVLFHGKPTLCVNAQILLGKPAFAVFKRADVETYFVPGLGI